MRRRTQSWMLVQPFLLGALALTAGSSLYESIAMAQQGAAPAAPNPYKQKVVTLMGKELIEKGSEKTKAMKPDRSDVEPIKQYYSGYLIPQLTQNSPDVINKARGEALTDIGTIESKALSAKFNPVLVELFKELVLRDADGKVFSPQCRINAMILLGRLNSEVTPTSSKPDARVHPILLSVLDEKGNDGLLSSALSILARHLRFKVVAAKGPPVFAVSERGFGLFVEKLKTLLSAPAPVYRDPDAHNYIMEQVIDCLTLIADSDPEKEWSKLAVAALTPELVKILDAQESEWLVERALLSFGTIKNHKLTPEDVLVVEKAIAKFTKESLRDWKKRIANSGAAGGMGGYGGEMGMGGGYPGGMPGGMEGGSGEGGYGMPGANRGAMNPYAKQPKEVKNARRIAHQRFERIHFALNGLFIGPKPLSTDTKEKAKPPADDKGLLALLSENAKEKEKVVELLISVEQFQTDLNDVKVVDLNSLSMVVTKSIRGMREAIEQILGDSKDEVTKEPEDDVFGRQ